jgi:parvulin-like peptidyl-prolyl isomerase
VARLRAAVTVTLDVPALDPARDARRDELAPVARIGVETLSWRRVRAEGRPPGATTTERVAEVDRVVATHLLADAACAEGADRDTGFEEMVAGWRRGELVRLVREEIVARKGLDEHGVAREYARHRAQFTLPAERKMQQIVVRTRAEAEQLRQFLAAPPPGTSFYTVARDRSIVPGAAQTLGVVGWVTRDQGHPVLTDAAFAVAPGEISAPIETDAGFHLIRVLDQHPEEVQALDDRLRERIRDRWNANRITEYAARLSETKYPVTLYRDVYRTEEPTARTDP